MSTENTVKNASGIDPRALVVPKTKTIEEPSKKAEVIDFKDAALEWFNLDFDVIPIEPGSKKSAVKWDSWLEGLSRGKITDYWAKHPDHELGFIVGDECVVLDADSPQALAALYQVENAFDVTPNLTIKTKKGEHHYFRCSTGVKVKSDSHSTDAHPDRIDIKAGRALVILPPSTGKSVLVDEINRLGELAEVGQDFIDAVFRHNGRTAPSEVQPLESNPVEHTYQAGELTRKVSPLLEAIDPDSGHDDWIRVGMALHNESGGNDEGFALFDTWSSKGSKYPGTADLRYKWSSFNGHTGSSKVSLGTIIKLARDNGANIEGIMAGSVDEFEPCETITVAPPTTASNPCVVTGLDDDIDVPALPSSSVKAAEPPASHTSLLRQYSLTGKSAELEAQLQEEVFVLDPIALLGQATMIFASPNAGKTLITLKLLMESIAEGRIDGGNAYHINMDDSLRGLTEKVVLSEHSGFHMISGGYKEFEPGYFIHLLTQLCDKKQANGTVIILDTVKKFTDLMDKRTATTFMRAVRRFIAQGGTLIGLAHVNKRKGDNGKSIYAGTTDLVDDADCAWVVDVTSHDKESGVKTVEFNNIKRRGSVPDTVSFTYRTDQDITYQEMLASVRQVDDSEASALKVQSEAHDDEEYIQVVEARIREGHAKKIDLVRALQNNSILSKNKAVELVDKYSRPDSPRRLWGYTTVEHGAHIFHIIPTANDAAGN